MSAPANGIEKPYSSTKNEIEWFTVVNDGSGKSFRIRKSVLAAEVGFFKTMFQNPWQEVETGVVHLHEERVRALDLLLQQLAQRGLSRHYGENVSDYMVVINARVTASQRSWAQPSPSHWPEWRLALDLYMVADKYGIPALQKYLTETTMIELFKGCYWKPLPRHVPEQVFTTVCEAFDGEYPEELYDLYCALAACFIEKERNADAAIAAVREDSDLLEYLSKYLVARVVRVENNLKASEKKTEDVQLNSYRQIVKAENNLRASNMKIKGLEKDVNSANRKTEKLRKRIESRGEQIALLRERAWHHKDIVDASDNGCDDDDSEHSDESNNNDQSENEDMSSDDDMPDL